MIIATPCNTEPTWSFFAVISFGIDGCGYMILDGVCGGIEYFTRGYEFYTSFTILTYTGIKTPKMRYPTIPVGISWESISFQNRLVN